MKRWHMPANSKLHFYLNPISHRWSFAARPAWITEEEREKATKYLAFLNAKLPN